MNERIDAGNPAEESPIALVENEAGMGIVLQGDRDRIEAAFVSDTGLVSLGDAVEKIARGLVADVTTKDGVKQIKAMARKIASVKVSVDNIGKKVVAELKERPRLIDRHRAEFRTRLEALQEEIRRPVTEIEARETEVRRLLDYPQGLADASSDEIRAAIERLEKEDLSEGHWKETLEKALNAGAKTSNTLQSMLSAAEKREKDAAELERLRVENERLAREQERERIRKEAEEKARKEAESRSAAELEAARLREERANKEAAAAKERAAEAERKTAEARETKVDASAAAQASPLPQEKESKWSPKAVDDREETQRRKVCNREAAEDIATMIFGAGERDVARAIIAGIIRGNVRHVCMNYEQKEE